MNLYFVAAVVVAGAFLEHGSVLFLNLTPPEYLLSGLFISRPSIVCKKTILQ